MTSRKIYLAHEHKPACESYGSYGKMSKQKILLRLSYRKCI